MRKTIFVLVLSVLCIFFAHQINAEAETTVVFGRPALVSSSYNNFPIYNDNSARHSGNDIPGSTHTAIYAVRSGTVRYAGQHSSVSSLGNFVAITDSQYGSITFIYAHLDSVAVSKSAKVEAGDVIGYMGQTGSATGPHLHLQAAWKGNATTGWSDVNLNTCFTRKSGYPNNAYRYQNGGISENLNGANEYRLVYNSSKAPGGKLRAMFVYPSTFKKGTSWVLKGGVVSPSKLNYVDVWIENSSGTRVAGMTSSKNPANYFFDINSIDSQVKMQNVSSDGTYYYCISAKDAAGSTLNVRQAFTASSSSTVNKNAKYESDSSSTSISDGSEGTLPGAVDVVLTQGVYQFNRDDESRSGPAEANSLVKSYTKGSIVFVVSSTVNSYGNTWYKISDGSWVWSGDVNHVTFTETPISGTYVFLKDETAEKYPYEASPDVKNYTKGSTVNVVASVLNTYGNTWYKLSDGSYVYSGDVSTGSVSVTVTGAVADSGTTNTGVPSGNLTKGKNFGLRGTITSSENMTKVVGHIINLKTGAEVTAAGSPKTATPNAKTLNIKSSAINNLVFDKLDDGYYQYTVVVTTASGYTKTVLDSKFTVGNGTATIPVSSVSLPDDLDLFIGEIGMTEAIVLPLTATNQKVTYTSSNPSVATVSMNGETAVITGVGVGSCTITATAADGSGKKGSCTITVNKKYVTSVSIESSLWFLPLGSSTSIGVDIEPADATDTSISYAVSNPSIISVSKADSHTLVLNALALGSSSVTVTANDGSGKSTMFDVSVHCEHNYQWVTVSEATTTEWGTEEHRCSICGDVDEIHSFPPLTPNGTCGEQASWHINETTLTIYGEGAITNYTVSTSEDGRPWAEYKSTITDVVVGYGITSIGQSCFESFSALTSVSLPESLTSLGAKSFRLCSELENISLPYSVNSIGAQAFDGCYKLTGINLPDGISAISTRCFHNCNLVTSYQIPESVKSINSHAFLNNYALVRIDIPASVTSIADDAFEGCSGFTIYCHINSIAHQFAVNHGITYELYSIPPESITGTKDVYLKIGESYQINATVLPDNTTNKSIHFSVDDPSIVSVSGDGLITALNHGVAYVTVACDEDDNISLVISIAVSDGGFSLTDTYMDREGKYHFTIRSYGEFVYSALGISCPMDGEMKLESNLRTDLAHELIDYQADNHWAMIHFDQSHNNENHGSQIIAEGCLVPVDPESMWKKTIDYQLGVYLYAINNVKTDSAGHSLLMPICAPHEQSLTLSFPQKTSVMTNADLILPSSLIKIEEEAFAGNPASRIRLSNNITTIGKRAFADCTGLTQIYIPENCVSIASDAFAGVNQLTIYGIEGSYAEFYAGKYGFSFVAIQ